MHVDQCPACGALPCDWVNTPEDLWKPIDTMPSGKWVFVYVPGVSGSGVEAIKKPSAAGAFWAGRIIGLQTGREIVRATHWRPAMLPPEGAALSDNSLYVGS